MSGLISVIVTTYEREDALAAALRALSRQTDRGFEAIVADDGSGPATAAMIEAWRERLGVSLSYVRHEHAGFRAAEIRNRAILASKGDYCVFLDGDCLARPAFVATHRRLAEPGWFVSGNRVLLSELLTGFTLQRDQEPECWSFPTWIGMRAHRAVNRLAPLLSLPLGPLRKLRSREWEQARSCNLGVWRCDLDRIDGFDAAFNGWGREDSDLLIRLLAAGARRKDGNFATGVLHLWHPEADRSAFAANDERLMETIRTKRVRAVAGMSTLVAASAAGGEPLTLQTAAPVQRTA